jgi:hypothetical protein
MCEQKQRSTMITPRRCAALVALATLGLLSNASAQADHRWPLDQTVNVSAGLFAFGTDTRIRLDGTNREVGTEVDFDDTFGFDDQNRLRIDGFWRFAERHKVRFMYFGSRSEASRTITEELEYGGVIYPVNATVTAEVDTDIIELAYEYAFMRRDTFELAGTIGLHNLQIKSRLSTNVSTTIGSGGNERSAEAKVDGPFPVIGIRGLWSFSENFYLDFQAQFFGLEFEEYDGNLQDYKVSFVWQPSKYVGVGIGYNEFVTKVDVDAERFLGELRFGYGGPLVFVTAGF